MEHGTTQQKSHVHSVDCLFLQVGQGSRCIGVHPCQLRRRSCREHFRWRDVQNGVWSFDALRKPKLGGKDVVLLWLSIRWDCLRPQAQPFSRLGCDLLTPGFGQWMWVWGRCEREVSEGSQKVCGHAGEEDEAAVYAVYQLQEATDEWEKTFRAHPALLDAALQSGSVVGHVERS